MQSRDREIYLISETSVDGGEEIHFSTDDLFIYHGQYTLTVLDTSIPKSWYNVTSSSNSLTIDGESFSVPIGNYSVFDIIEVLNTLQNVIFFSFDSSTGLARAELSVPNISVNFSTNIEILKFQNGTITDFILSSEICNTTITRFVHLVCKQIHTDNQASAERLSSGNILASINASDVSAFEYITKKSSSHSVTISARTPVVSISLQDDHGRTLDLNGQHWSLLLQIHSSTFLQPSENN